MRKEIIYLLFPMLVLLFSACRKELDEPVPTGEQGWTTVHLRATVSGNLKTKATLDDDDRHYLFDRDDLLYVVNKNSGRELYGFLYLIAGAGETDAVFEGDLMYFNPSTKEPEEPDSGFDISATLVSAAQRSSGFFTTVSGNDGKIDSGPNYGNAVAATFKEAVQKYSHFTGDATYGNPSFSLNQQSAFVIFKFSFDDDLGSGDLTFNVNNNGSPVRTMTVTPDTYKRAGFVAAFPNETALSSAYVTVTGGGLGGGSGVQRDLRNAMLQANRYYNVNQCYVDLTYFTIQAGSAATEITFNYSTIEYSTDNGSTWTSAGTTPTVSLAAGAHLKVRGNGTTYDYNTESKTIFTSTGNCTIYGDIMSLFLNHDTFQKDGALRGAFKNMTNIDIPPGRPLLLSATDLKKNNCYEEMFLGCTGLTYPPEFRDKNGDSALTITRKACHNMFSGCTSLKEAPELPATTVNDLGYYGMFKGCTSLEIPPIKLAQTVNNPTNNIDGGSCREMFSGCTSLRYAPELPATSVPVGGYYSMFSGCTSLLAAPELPATTVATSGYYKMFENCSAMVTGPSELPAETMNANCYYAMFSGCSSLVDAPEIKAVTLATSCFNQMFLNCSLLRTAQKAENKFYFSGNIPASACYQMFMSCLALNNAPNMPNVTGTIGTNGCKDMYNNCGEMATAPTALNATTVEENGYHQMFYNCLKINAAPNISATNVGKNGCYRMFYGCSRLQTPPEELPATTLAYQAYREMFYGCKALKSAPTFPAGNATFGGDNVCYQMFYTCITISELTGTLFGAGTELTSSCFNQMFYGCSALKTVPENFLPATSPTSSCFNSMFYGTAIVRAPNLPATTTVANNCYQNMFRDCTYLNTVPQNCLPATTLASSCYQEMFRGCTSLTTAPDLPATTLASSCYQGMFYSTKLTQSPSLPATTLADNCYKEMFRGCTSLTTAPVLPATTLTSSCYQGMFYGSGLTQAPSLPAETLANNCYREMFQSCASLTTAPVLPATTLATSCYQGMFYSTGLTQAPSLPAETLAANCYQYMFRGCTSLTTAPNLPATTLAANCYQEMFRGCSSLTTAPDLPATTLASSCYQGMFYSSKLTQSPLLPAETLEANCYKEMFRDCKSLNQITCLATTISATDCLKDWVNAVAAAGTFVKAASATSWPTGVSGIPSGWTVGDYTPPTP